ncbi:hypothetical protein P3T76_011576 [Phytophthora citrophthora]|uniref:Uncharacterized protein n=1 Tax=Phytophthora citrophthora TaxID=4793 RepID=A0AAD9LEZ8_9STRA|nr:hypothetical protein P3T76_011576 [Phytophthora citrophthora]
MGRIRTATRTLPSFLGFIGVSSGRTRASSALEMDRYSSIESSSESVDAVRCEAEAGAGGGFNARCMQSDGLQLSSKR